MEEQEKVYEEKGNEKGAPEKNTYHTPVLTRLGNVRELTQGIPAISLPDVGGNSL